MSTSKHLVGWPYRYTVGPNNISTSESSDNFIQIVGVDGNKRIIFTVTEPAQWIVQKKGTKKDGWKSVAFCTTRKGLLRNIVPINYPSIDGPHLRSDPLYLLAQKLPERASQFDYGAVCHPGNT